MLQRWGGLTNCNNFVYSGGEGGTITVLLFVFQPTVKKQMVARTGFPGSCLSNVCCPALLCVCVCERERNSSAHCISCWFVFCSNFIHVNSPGNSVCLRPEGLHLRRVSPLWKDVVALKCPFCARKHPSCLALSSWSPAASGWVCLWAAVCPGGGCGVPSLGGKGWHVSLVVLLWSGCCASVVSLVSCGATLCSCF